MSAQVNRKVAVAVILGAIAASGIYGAKQFRGEPASIAAAARVAPVPVPRESALPTLHIEVDPDDLELMQLAILKGDPALGRNEGGNKPWVKATYSDERGITQKAKIAYRGLGQWHHHPEKPSLRVKIRKKSLESGHRDIELQRPEGALAMRNWLPDRLGRQMGLLSVQLDHVRLFINGEYRGVYVRNVRPGASTLMAAGRIPGTLFKGDNWHASLWASADAWKQRSETPEATQLFNDMLSALRQPISPGSVNRFQSFLDMHVYTRWAALLIIAGSVHADNYHNHLFHVAPERGKVEAIPWDICGFGIQATPDLPLDVISHPLAQQLSHDPRWIHRRNTLLYELLRGELAADEQIEIVGRELARVLPDLRADPNIASLEKLSRPTAERDGGYGLVPWTAADLTRKQQELEDWIQKRAAFILAYLGNARVAVEANADRPGFSRVSVFGNVAVAVTSGENREPEVLHPGLTTTMHSSYIKPFKDSPITVLAPVPVPLEYDVQGAPESLRFTNAITGDPVTPSDSLPTIVAKTRTIHREMFDELEEPTGTVAFGPGDVRVSETVRIGAQQRLVIRAGTRLLMDPGVSIFSRGPVMVEGTANAPVEITPADDDKAWGTFGVIGPATHGSSFRYLKVHGGGAGTDGQAYFKGMFNVYESEDAVIENCEFGANAHGDDAVNIVSSTFIVKDSHWRNALSDALDIDVSRGVIQGSRFANSGNDGLDVMGSRILVRDCQMVENGDKGMSVGEQASVMGERLEISRNQIGVEVKDDSSVFLSHVSFDGNRTAWHGYRKKPFYPSAGRGLLADSSIVNSGEADVSLEKLAELELLNTKLNADGHAAGVKTVSVASAEWAEWAEALTSQLAP
jgi:hypothetical protein